VLPLVIGRATRLAQFLTASDKDYEATVAFGRTTNTYDAMGTVTGTSGARPSREQIEAALAGFRGTFAQTPPAFSAKNIGGERSYDIARKAKDGVVVLPKAATVTVRDLDLWSCDGETAVLHMRVTAGFYVRSLSHDLGAALGMGAVLTGLRRTRSGEFGLDGAVPLADVLQAGREALAGRLLPFSGLLPELAAVTLRGPEQVVRIKNGVEIAPADLVASLTPLPELVRVMGADGTLVALARPAKTPGFLHAAIVLA
jgi:tRNA pseudouridine55 synthase